MNEYVTIALNRNLSNCEIALSRVDELNKLASLQCMGLHSSTGRALQRSVEAPLKPRKTFFRTISQLLKLRFTAMVTYSFHLYSRSSHHFIQCCSLG